ncbi:6-bladed beta-propeller protein [Sphingobacterium detergens]|uniref:6-bladed beta-propeller protein n=1 Tax=Sphingobacterium detergens TaxID=1145106 RepID=A0A420ALE8_SPHD1|nr:6-bladed beta-propeller protein [Sphingobacterium detergens]
MRPIILLLTVISILSKIDVKAQNLIYAKDIPNEKIRIIPETTQGGTVSELLSDLEYIPLKRTNNKLLSDVYELESTAERIGILNRDGHFHLYDIKGNLLKIINTVIGVEDKKGILLFSRIKFNEKGVELLHGPFKARYDMNGNFIDTISNRKDESKNVTQIGTKKWTYYSPDLGNPQIKTTNALQLGDSIMVKYEKLDSVLISYGLHQPLSPNFNNKAYASFDYNTKLFELDSNGISKVYQFIFPLKNTVNLDEVRKVKDYINYMHYYNAHREEIRTLDNVINYKNHLILQLKKPNNFWIALNLATKNVIGLTNILPDKSSDYLPFMDSNILRSDGEYLFSFLSPQDIRIAISKSKEEFHPVSERLRMLEKSNNPVFVRFKLK